MKFNDLSIQEKAAVIKLGVGSGLRSLLLIEDFYNSSQLGDNRPMAVRMMDRSNADFAKRMRDPRRMTIRDWVNSADRATHKMAWDEDDKGTYIFPVVQRHGNYLKDYSDPRYSYNDAALIALLNGDYMRTLNPLEAEWLTANYKDYYPGFNDPLVNASIGREYSMPDYMAVAMTSSPMYGIEWNPDDDELDYRDIRNRQLYLESAGKVGAKSNKGAQGIFQIMPGTAKWYQDSTGDIGDIWDPVYNERVRDWTMDRNWESDVVKEGNPSNKTRMKKALAAYDRGVGNLKKDLDRAKKDGIDIINGDAWLDYLPSETRNYVNFIMNGLDASEHKTQEKYQEWLGSGNEHIKAYGGLVFDGDEYRKGGSIHIKPLNRGKFTALKKRTGHSASWFKAHGTPALRKMATFALNARKWHHKHPDGGSLFDRWRQYMQDNTIDVPMTFSLPEVQIIAQAPKPGDTNYDKYIANTYDAWQRGDIDINTLPTETRNRVRGYSGTIAAQKGMDTAAKVASITASIPTALISGISAAPLVLRIMSIPIVNTAFTIKGAIDTPENIKEGFKQFNNGNIGKGILDLGLTALDLYGAGKFAQKVYNTPRRLANNIYRYLEPVGYNGHDDEIKNIAKAMIFDGDIHNEVRDMYYFPKKFSPGRDAAFRSWLGFDKRTNFPFIYREMTKEEELAAKAAGLWKYDKGLLKYSNLTTDEYNLTKINSVFPSNYLRNDLDANSLRLSIKRMDEIKPNEFLKNHKLNQLKESYKTGIDSYIGAHGNINTLNVNGEKYIQDTWDINPFTKILGYDFDFGMIFPNHKAINLILKIPD